MVLYTKKIWDGPTTEGNLDLSSPFENADFLIFQSQVDGDELEIAAALQINLVGIESIGGIEISVIYGTKEIPLDVDFISTSEIICIPEELSQTGQSMRLILATSYSVSLSIYAASRGVSDQGLNARLAEINQKIDELLLANTEILTISGEILTVAGVPLII